MKARGGRAAGVPNYQNDVLINVIEAVLPDGPLQWSIVAQRYQEASGEREIRDGHDIKRHFTTHKNLCNNGKKVTGSSAPKPQVARCQYIWHKILRKSSASNCGGGDSEDDMRPVPMVESKPAVKVYHFWKVRPSEHTSRFSMFSTIVVILISAAKSATISLLCSR